MSIFLPRSFPPSDHRRTEIVRFNVSSIEKQRLQQKAAAYGRPLAELLRVAVESLLNDDDPAIENAPGAGTGKR